VIFNDETPACLRSRRLLKTNNYSPVDQKPASRKCRQAFSTGVQAQGCQFGKKEFLAKRTSTFLKDAFRAPCQMNQSGVKSTQGEEPKLGSVVLEPRKLHETHGMRSHHESERGDA
jgi:hypothetical protein